MPADATTLAEEALRLAGVDARAADLAGREAIDAARAERNTAAESRAWRARGLAAREADQLEPAEAHLRRAVAVGRRAGTEPEGEARMSLALIQLERGQLPAARRNAHLAAEALNGLAQARARMHLGLIEQRSGALEAAHATYGEALKELQRENDELWQARLLNNRGILNAYRGQIAAAERDLTRCEAIMARLGQATLAADAHWNLGFVAGLRGDAVTALRRFDEAGRRLAEVGVGRNVHALDQCQVLLSVGLAREARDVIEAGITDLRTGDGATDLAEATLLLSETLLATGDRDGARRAALDATALLSSQRRTVLVVLAQYALLRSTAYTDESRLWDTAAGVEVALVEAGWPVAATDVALLIAQRSTALGRPIPEGLLATAMRATRSGSAGQRMRAWHTVALGRLASGDRAAASRALLAGVQVHDRDRIALAATELQVHTAARVQALTETGLGLALEAGAPARVFAWAERGRAGSMLVRSVGRETDDVLGERLAALRAVSVEIEQARLSGESHAGLSRRQAGLERAVARQARLVRATTTADSTASAAKVLAALGDQALIELVRVGSGLIAVVLADGRSTVHRLGPYDEVLQQLEIIRYALGRQARGGSERVMAAGQASMRAAASQLDTWLLAPLTRRVRGRSVVMVPTGELHAAPWALLPSLSECPLTVAPSASVWLGAEQHSAAAQGDGLLVAGPGLPGAVAELAAVGAVYEGQVHRLTAETSTVAAVLSAMSGARFAHIASHGEFRSDNPQFSSLQLADGALTVFDIETVQAPPSLVVLSACDGGLSGVSPGDELMGLASALLRMGSRTMLASVAPVPDEVALEAMVGFHAALVDGHGPAQALVSARAGLAEEQRAVAAAFVCFGAG